VLRPAADTRRIIEDGHGDRKIVLDVAGAG